MAGGGTGGHVIPAIAVAKELARAGHTPQFVGTERGVEARLVPSAGFPLKVIRVGGLKNLGALTKVTSVFRLIAESFGQLSDFAVWKPAAVFSMGGYVAGPPVVAALLRGVPVIVMEPNAIPGATNKWIARWVRRALINFEETRRYFPAGRTELTGLPVREEFFNLPPKAPSAEFTILITGGSQGSRTLNNAARDAWPLFLASGLNVRLIHQTGTAQHADLARDFAATALKGEVVPFIGDMPGAFAQADLIVCRSGAGAVSELAAAGKPSILIPFPFAADDHQTSNAQVLEHAGAALRSSDKEWTGTRFFEAVRDLAAAPERLRGMSEAVRRLAHPHSARRAAEILLAEGANPSKNIDSMGRTPKQ
ncbi:MAG TPA: undecaprenyldiphospho-muramoylpentapeptide beta-N-acetylglucosaminyltransferase [Bryobacteraceae bacterium]|nr:undecaprenyldiphospho-muramoylpentapeptide beta-N-acetylglucosaminyltransferase [Bryobacteraceae bacterium]